MATPLGVTFGSLGVLGRRAILDVADIAAEHNYQSIWTVEANGPVIRDAIAIFGLDRAMFASNFPVDGLVGDFDTIFSGFLAATAAMTEVERDRLFHDNARRIYRF